MEIKTIKGIDEETWKKFKVLAVENDLKMSILLKMMVNEFKKNSIDFWNKTLNRDRNLDDSEAKDMLKISLDVRKEKGFRI